MKNVLSGGVVLLLAFVVYSFALPTTNDKSAEATTVKWYSFEEAVKLSEKEPKKIFIDVYTDWCGWCKRMDKTTFGQADIASYLNENFYPVKFNAEQKETITFKGHELKYKAAGRRGVHELAYSLLDGRLGYPAIVYLDEDQNRISISPGYKAPDAMKQELEYISGEHYKTSTFQDYISNTDKK